ncbi:MAG: hypothetical protein ABJF86_04870 [Tateyamaria sp.]|uniref:hypothetical protein n=1 Tax=Tateyamaria sp. TaxID=1929288 RepID=UPI00327B664B
MSGQDLHPSELAYAFSWSKSEALIGWGSGPFRAKSDAPDALSEWYQQGAERLKQSGHLLLEEDGSFAFEEAFTAGILTLVDPTVVLCAERKDGEAVRRMTVHMAKDRIIGLMLRQDGFFDVTRYADLTAATAACAAFLGASIEKAQSDARIDTPIRFLDLLQDYTRTGKARTAARALIKVGMSTDDAASAARALAEPIASGMLSVFYCSGNTAQDVEVYNIRTNSKNESWALFPPASLAAPVTLEASSVSALAARVSVAIIARMALAKSSA